MASLAAVRDAARSFLAVISEEEPLDVFICSTVVLVRSSSTATTADGFELLVGVNYMAHALLIRLLLPALKRASATGGGDVMQISSLAALLNKQPGPPNPVIFKDPDVHVRQSYPQSKIDCLLHARVLARRNPDLTVLIVHSGMVDTPGSSKLPWFDRTSQRALGWVLYGGMMSLQEGCKSYLWACMVKKGDIESGGFYGPAGVPAKGTKFCGNEAVRRVLWEWTELEVEQYLDKTRGVTLTSTASRFMTR